MKDTSFQCLSTKLAPSPLQYDSEVEKEPIIYTMKRIHTFRHHNPINTIHQSNTVSINKTAKYQVDLSYIVRGNDIATNLSSR